MTTPKPIDVLIVGAGPVGLAASLFFGIRGYTTVLIEQYGKDSENKNFNERNQQVGLDPDSLIFLNKHFPEMYKKIINDSCPDGDWITISIKKLQNILYHEAKKISNLEILFNSKIESVTSPHQSDNARVIVSQDLYCGPDDDKIYAFYPELVIICDGKHDHNGTARKHFNFSPASRVTLSSSGIIGMLKRDNLVDNTCLVNFSKDNFETRYGPMHVRILGSLKERYIGLGSGNCNVDIKINNLSSEEIEKLLLEVYNQLKDSREPFLEKFDEFSKKPIPIILDYRKETIKLFEGSNTIVSVEGDAARKTTFFSGSGLNSGWKALDYLFSFCEKHNDLIFDNDNLINIDEILLEKDQKCLEISMELLKKGSRFIISNHCLKL